jgi:hypothetical protein
VAGAFSFGALCAAAAFTHSEWRTEFMRDKVESAERPDHRSGGPALETAANRPSDSPPQETRDGAEQLNLNQVQDSASACVAAFCRCLARCETRFALRHVVNLHLADRKGEL